MASLVDTAKSTAAKLLGGNEKSSQLAADTQQPTSSTPIKSYFGVSQADTDNALRAGPRGPTLLEDAHFREKVSHFDHERIPERVVHARGAGAHGNFVLHTPISDFTHAPLFTDTSRKTPVFVRFSTVGGSRGSADTVRDVRGFATRFYAQEGNFDIVGNNVPVFFVQDAIKFLDLIHAIKPEPDKEIPQAQTAHDNAWDFWSLTPESMHAVTWVMSDRAIPRSYRMMQGFGVHSFVLVNADGKRSFVKFHWTPKLGVHSLVWDEALKLNGQDPDFHRRDLYDAIDAGAYPQWDLGVQIVPEAKEHDFDFDLLDATKIIPEELVPVKYIGTLTLDRRPDEFFPEVEQVAFCTQHMIPGVEHSNDPLLQGRGFSYFDTQISRLGGPNFSDIPINRPICPVFNNQRDGFHRKNYYPNREDAPAPVAPEHGGYLPTPMPIEPGAMKVRMRGPKFSDHHGQATLFWNSMSAVEKELIISAMSFELGKCDDPVVHQNAVAQINKIDNVLAKAVASSLSLSAPEVDRVNPGHRSEYLSQLSDKNVFTATGRKVGIFVLDGFSTVVVGKLKTELVAIGCLAMIVGPRKGTVTSAAGVKMETQFSFETCRSTHFDALFFPSGDGVAYAEQLSKSGRLIHAAREAYSHYKAIGACGTAVDWLRTVALAGEIQGAYEGVGLHNGVVLCDHDTDAVASLFTEKFIGEVAKHRAWGRDVSRVAA
ncbi:putative catalase A [Clavulina sp. PMI_390]|nr:putative catalase A [Clavulina sp. PMI_390]